MTPHPSLSALIVNYERADLLGECLRALEQALAQVDGPHEVIVIDNGSRDGSTSLVRTRFPSTLLVELPENRGFPAGVNEGLRRSRAEWVLVLNNDAIVEPEAVAHLLAVAGLGDDVGSVAAQLRFSGEPRINSAGIGVDRLGVAFDRLVGAPLAAGEAEPVEVFGASAGAALYRRAMLDEVGGFDASFFAFLEDVDVAWRARMRGWRCLYAPDARAEHRHSATARHGSSFKHFHVGRNRVRLLAKNMDAHHLRRYAPAIVAYDLGHVLFAALADRTLAPLSGRLAGLREWRAYRARNEVARRPVRLAPVRGVRAALARRAAWPRRAPSSGADTWVG